MGRGVGAPARSFLGFQLGAHGIVEWTAKALERFNRRVKESTQRNRALPARMLWETHRVFGGFAAGGGVGDSISECRMKSSIRSALSGTLKVPISV